MPATAIEQEILELINRARLDPAAEAARDGIDLNEGLAAGTISTASKQPLAMNETLLSISLAHDQDMIAQNYFAHNTPSGQTPFDRMTAAGYSYSTAGENIAWYGSSAPLTTQNTLDLEKQLFVDAGVSGRGHRVNLMDPDFQEIGDATDDGAFQGVPYATLITQDFGTPSAGGQFLTGVSYVDANQNNFYDIGEGRNNVSVSVSGGGSTATAGAGGYSLAVAAGQKTVTFSGGGLASPVTVGVTVLASTNAKVDMVDQGTIMTSASLADLGGATRIMGLGTIGLTLTGNASNETFSGTKGNDTINGGGGVDTVDYSSVRSAYSVTRSGKSYIVSGPDGTDTLTGIDRLAFSDQTVNIGVSDFDFNGDGNSDILWRNASSGDTGYWAVTSNAAVWHDLGAASTAYSVVGVGDLNGDGASDIVWRNAANGDTGSWILNGSGYSWNDYGLSGTSYNVAGVGDLNGDGAADIVWRNDTTGSTGYWQSGSNGTSMTWRDLGSASTAYRIAGVGDFNGDGTADILWHNASNGDTGFWAMASGGGSYSWVDLGVASTAYSVVGVGDINGDGTKDILWRNASTGDTGAWLISNNVATWHDYGVTDTSYSVVGLHDYNGDGTADVLWRRASDGDTGYWAMSNGGATATWHDFGTTSTAYAVANV